ncbi:MAG: DNA-processing protein DprA, partial [Treponema sp.]|nr:DNA-processing protein DprA [Treponema sp.]
MVESLPLDLLIARLPGISHRARITLIETFSDEAELRSAKPADLKEMLGCRSMPRWDFAELGRKAGEDGRKAKLRGLGWVSWRSSLYPPLLREIYDPPAVLFFRGRLPDAERPMVAVVGTRRPSPEAGRQAGIVSRELALGGIPTVSGLALGIDALAHRGCVEGGAATFAVLGSGADEVFPASNRPLARRVLESGGGLLSEYPPETAPTKWSFPQRNRIVAGLARGVLIVEAPEKSGALITARLALEQNRDVWVAAVGIGEAAGFDRRGTQRLVEQGAEVVYSASDVFK